MATLDSTSTLDEIKAAYADNASYSENDSTTQAAAFVTACRLLLLKLPKRVSGGNDAGEVELEPRLIAEELQEARQWLSLRQSAGGIGTGVKHVDFAHFRE